MKVEVPSRSPSSLRPHVYFTYEASAQMFFEQVEFVRVTKEEADSGPVSDGED